MRAFGKTLAALVLLVALPLAGNAAPIQVTGGSTSVLFGNGALADLGLEVTSVTPNVKGSIGKNSVSFGINPPNAIGDALDTTFIYESDGFFPVSGAIEHSGLIQFNDSVEVGNFTIELVEDRGFVVKDNYSIGAILFDIADPIVEAFEDSLVIAANLLVSPELADFLGAPDAAGTDVGMALVDAHGTIVPIPAAAWMFGSALGLLAWVRRRV